MARRAFRPGHQEVEILDQPLLHFLARHDGVDQAVIEQEFGGLKAGRQFGLGGVLDDARPGKADHRARLGDDQIAHAGVAGHHAGGGGMGEHADVGQAAPWRGRPSAAQVLAICIRLNMPSYMRAPPLVEMMMSGRPFSVARFDQARQFFAHHRAHRAAEKAEIHHAQRDAVFADLADAGDDGVLETVVFL